MKRIKRLLIILLFVFIPTFINAEGMFYDNYRINKYDIEINVNEDNSFDISETILAEFNTLKHGIFRKIPLTNTIIRPNGYNTSNSATISNIKVSENYTTYKEGNYKVIKIGSASKTFSGEREYKISYHYALSYDYNKDYDEFYYNIIGNEWDTSISNVTFKVTMPKKFDISKFGLSSGTYGTTGTKNTEYNIKDNLITGKYIGVLNPREAITMRIELPEGYFIIPESVIKEEEQKAKDLEKGLGEFHDGYRINKYDVEMKVNKNNTFDITENITAEFNVLKHGIYRKIPIKNIIRRTDGSSSKVKATIENVSVNDNFTIEDNNDYKTIKIGSNNQTLMGEKQYKIDYTYVLNTKKPKGYDEFYFNIIGTQWDTSISHISFKIEMPESFDKSKVGISTGSFGTVGSDSINYSVDGKIITGNYIGILRPYEGLTIRIELPDGYFDYGININIYNTLLIVLSILFAYLSFRKFKLFGVDDVIVETVEFYPPEGYSSLDIGYYYNNRTESKDVVSLLIYLANKGYIKISDRDENGKQLKEYDGNDRREKEFLRDLFKKRKHYDFWGNLKEDENDDKNTVDKYDLEDRFYSTIDLIKYQTDHSVDEDRIYSKGLNSGKKYIILFICLLFIMFVISFFNNDLDIYEILSTFFVLIIGMIIFICGFSIMFARIFDSNQFKADSKSIHIVGSLFLLTIGGMILYGILSQFNKFEYYFEVDSSFIIGIILFVFSCSIMVACYKNMRKRTPFGTKIIGQIRGFKNFLETAEKKELEMLVAENPSYFYDILPYTYVLGISNKWIKKFESIGIKAPEWYDSPSSTFNVSTMSSFMSKTMSSTASSLSSRPGESGGGGSSGGSSSGHSSSGGGGSSGGGSGGGGGGSW